MNRLSRLLPSPVRRHQLRCLAWSVGVIAAVTAAHAAEPALSPPGVMLQQGEWRGSVGSYEVPAPFEKIPAAQWPMDGWVASMCNATQPSIGHCAAGIFSNGAGPS